MSSVSSGRGCFRGRKNFTGGLKINSRQFSKVFKLDYRGTFYLCSTSSQVVVKLVHVQEGLIGFPGIAGFAEASPANFELHGRSLVAIAAVVDDRLSNELLLVMLSERQRRSWVRVIIERSHVVDVSGDVLAAD